MNLPLAARVPGDVEPTALHDLVQDCHDLPGILAARPPAAPAAPAPTGGPLPVIHTDAVAAVEGLSAYGS